MDPYDGPFKVLYSSPKKPLPPFPTKKQLEEGSGGVVAVIGAL